ncbi:putative alginate O-acetyltransferase [Azospirillum sp. CAG:260]|jgi:alginate O-acetyltransferase|uniref:MBOAT family O-acyltransferase n=1 Tax=Candidatus Scatocola faecipullorum TaxID=2840917 RepID=UPI00033852EB|nr:MAG: MBOAT family protein [Azospirillum sp.]CDB40106.1 putative alginate O-acetyltransferase [Azospirillum sp. CAG:260]
MLFSSMTFLFVFMPLVMAVYFLSKKEIRNYVLLIASIIFYAWGEPRYLAIMIITILVNYAGAILLDKHYSSRQRLWIVSLTIVLDLSFLFYFKYFNFVVDNINGVLATDFQLLDVIMPIGISFYTFQAMSYLIDVYRREVPAQKDVYKLALYIVLFPQLVAGPIVKYHDVCEQIDNRTIEFKNVIIGFKRFITGLAKKVLIANTLAEVVDKIFAQAPENLTTGVSWLGAVAYCLQLYYDFSGYSDMAIGLGLMFGFRFLENFNYPYISKSITEFWRRWHISLATWFKLYLYIPLGGNRKGAVRTYWNLFAVFLVTGIWHGAAWSYVAWGIWNGIFIVIERFFGLDKDKNDRWYVSAAKHVYAFFAIVWGMIIFRAESLSYAYEYICRMLHIDVTKHLPDYDYGVNNKFAIMLIVGLICAMPVCRNLIYIKYEHKVQRTLVNIWLFLLFFWSTISLAASTYNPFIYFRF